MKYPNDEEIKAFIQRQFPEAGQYLDKDEGVEIERRGAEYRITVTKMYDRDDLSLTFEKRLNLSEFFDTMLVEEYDEIANGGCESCDWGSRYGFVFRIAPGKPWDPEIRRLAELL